jgi:hypothetical protein
MINKVTITGADDSIHPEELVHLSEEFSFAEWGILVSRKNFGSYRFPSKDWLDKLLQFPNLQLSAHLCGAYVREFLKGNFGFKDELITLFDSVKRIQINTHGEPHEWNARPIFDFITRHPEKDFIFQYDNVNTDLFEVLAKDGLTNISALYDLSHGAGLLPQQWPKPLSYAKCGYAGGLSPENLRSQISSIESIVGNTEIWIDMETHVRSNMDYLFDTSKVRKCLEISSDVVSI